MNGRAACCVTEIMIHLNCLSFSCLNISGLTLTVCSILRSWVQANPDFVNKLLSHGWTLLHMATFRNETQIVEFLLSVLSNNGCRREVVNMTDEWITEHRKSYLSDRYPVGEVDRASALHYACMTGNMEVVKMLLRAGADWSIKDSTGRKPVDYFILHSDDGSLRKEFQRLCQDEEERRKETKEFVQVKNPAKFADESGTGNSDRFDTVRVELDGDFEENTQNSNDAASPKCESIPISLWMI